MCDENLGVEPEHNNLPRAISEGHGTEQQDASPSTNDLELRQQYERELLTWFTGVFIVLAFISQIITKDNQLLPTIMSPYLTIIGFSFGRHSREKSAIRKARQQDASPSTSDLELRQQYERELLTWFTGVFIVLAFIGYILTRNVQLIIIAFEPYLAIIGFFFGRNSQ